MEYPLIQGNKIVMFDLARATNFAKAFSGFYGYEKHRVPVVLGTYKGQQCCRVSVPQSHELDEFMEMFRQGQIKRSW